MLFLLVASIVFERLVSFFLGLPSLSSIVALCWLTVSCFTTHQRLIPAFTLVIGYIGIAFLAGLTTLIQFNQLDMTAFARGFVFFITPFACFHLFYNRPHRLPQLLTLVIIFAVTNAAATLMQYWGLEYYGYGLQGDDVLTFDAVAKFTDTEGAIRIRPPGIVGNYHESGLLGATGLLALLIRITRGSVATFTDLILSGFLLLGIYASFSRAILLVALLFFSAILANFLFQKRYWKTLHQIIGVGGISLMVLLGADYFSSAGFVDSIVRYVWNLPDVVDASDRSVMFKDAFSALVTTSPFIGLGFGYAGRAAVGTPPLLDVNLIDYPLITLLSEAGILGFVIFAYFLAIVHFRTIKIYRGVTTLILVSFFISLLFGDFLLGKLSKHLVFSILGALLAQREKHE